VRSNGGGTRKIVKVGTGRMTAKSWKAKEGYVFSDLGKENDMLDEPDALRNVVTKSDIYSFPPV
jgi:hypothetical protein